MEWESIYDFVKWVMLREQLGAEYLDAYRYIKDATDNFENYNVGKFRAAFCDAVEQFKDHVERWFYQNPLEADYMPNDLCNGCYNEVMELLDRKLNGINESVIKQPQQITLPKELDNDEAAKYFAKAIKVGVMDEKYNWLKGLQLLACFAREMSLKLGLDKGYNSDGTPRISWKPFEQLFRIDKNKLRSNYNDIQKIGQSPLGTNLIDKIFE